ncbi:T9SS type A sorting domain-containing protein [bacterium SCSIO 12741]|nr:T9SS type A sorting domain-containing protein [bacterium SCSIO 12741]
MVFPNPVREDITIETRQARSYEATVINAQGAYVHSWIGNSGEKIELNFLQSGIYFFSIKVEGEQYFHREVNLNSI